MLSDALNFAISMSLKFKDEIDFATFDNLMEENANVFFKLWWLASNIKKEVVGFGIPSFHFKENMKKKIP